MHRSNPHVLSKELSPENGWVHPRNSLRERHKEIGQQLNTLEASTYRVGIPFPFPTEQYWQIRAAIGDLDDFLQIQLSNISTQQLESYLDDLCELSYDIESNRLLGLFFPSNLERYGVITIITGLTLILSFALFPPLHIQELFALGCIFIFLLISLFFGYLLGTEKYRRNSFIWCIGKELARRKGIGLGDRLTPVKGPV